MENTVAWLERWSWRTWAKAKAVSARVSLLEGDAKKVDEQAKKIEDQGKKLDLLQDQVNNLQSQVMSLQAQVSDKPTKMTNAKKRPAAAMANAKSTKKPSMRGGD